MNARFAKMLTKIGRALSTGGLSLVSDTREQEQTRRCPASFSGECLVQMRWPSCKPGVCVQSEQEQTPQ